MSILLDEELTKSQREAWQKRINELNTANSKIIELLLLGNLVLAVNLLGICWSYNRCKFVIVLNLFSLDTDKTIILNQSGSETIKSLFLNHQNSSLLLVSIK